MTKHVDDLKLTGRRDAILQVIQELQKVFGDLKVDWNEFTNCGVRHVQDPNTKEVTLDQHDYIKNMRPICHPQLKSNPDEDATPELHQLYMSLLGAVAYASQTRVDALVFICALQRHNSKPKVEHCVRLNKVLKWLQRTPKRLKYGRLVHNNTPKVSMEGEIPTDELPSAHVVPSSTTSPVPTHLRIVSDAAFKKEPEDGYSLRGALFMRCPGRANRHMVCDRTIGHLIDWACKSQKCVTRSTFSAELLAAGDATDQGILLSQILWEVEVGPLTKQEAKERRDSGGFLPMSLYVDAKSIYAAITAVFIKPPADKSLLTAHPPPVHL